MEEPPGMLAEWPGGGGGQERPKCRAAFRTVAEPRRHARSLPALPRVDAAAPNHRFPQTQLASEHAKYWPIYGRPEQARRAAIQRRDPKSLPVRPGGRGTRRSL